MSRGKPGTEGGPLAGQGWPPAARRPKPREAPASIGPGDPDAFARLQRELSDAEAAGLRIPCQGAESVAWTRDAHLDEEGSQLAAMLCLDCPAVRACRAVGLEEPGGTVWGGRVVIGQARTFRGEDAAGETRRAANRARTARRAAEGRAS